MTDPNYTLEWRRRPSDDWEFVRASANNLLAVKAWCRGYRKHAQQAEFKIYLNGKLYLISARNSSWRLRWLGTDSRTREEMKRQMAAS